MNNKHCKFSRVLEVEKTLKIKIHFINIIAYYVFLIIFLPIITIIVIIVHKILPVATRRSGIEAGDVLLPGQIKSQTLYCFIGMTKAYLALPKHAYEKRTHNSVIWNNIAL